MEMSDERLFDPLREFETLEIIKGELQERYVAAASETGDIAIAQLAVAIATVVQAQSALHERMTRGWAERPGWSKDRNGVRAVMPGSAPLSGRSPRPEDRRETPDQAG